MILNNKKTDFLVLKGVKIDDFSYKPLILKQQRQEKTPVYTDIPHKFTSVEDWIKVSNLKCWECDRFVSTYPKFIPMNAKRELDVNQKYIDVCDVLGNFDEWSCAVSYINTKIPANQRIDAVRSLLIFEAKFSGERKIIIHPSPPKTIMQQYCGNNGITSEEYQKRIEDISNEYKINN